MNICALAKRDKGMGIRQKETEYMCIVGCCTTSDVWQGTSGTSRDVPAVVLESLSGLKMCCEKKGERERERE